VFVSDTSSGRVRGMRRGEPLVTYRLNKVDTRKLVRGMTHVAEIFFAAGAREVYTGIPGKHFVKSVADLEDVKEEAVRPGALRLTAFHPVGTARMGGDPAAAVVDPWGECHDVRGLFVTDGSMLPGCPTVNPQITIMAFATRSADHLVRHGARYF
jgi:choline dehydrogenase-like flavoprotein